MGITGLTSEAIQCREAKNNGDFVAMANKIKSEVGFGEYRLNLTATETDVDLLSFYCTGVGAIPYRAIFATHRPTTEPHCYMETPEHAPPKAHCFFEGNEITVGKSGETDVAHWGIIQKSYGDATIIKQGYTKTPIDTSVASLSQFNAAALTTISPTTSLSITAETAKVFPTQSNLDALTRAENGLYTPAIETMEAVPAIPAPTCASLLPTQTGFYYPCYPPGSTKPAVYWGGMLFNPATGQCVQLSDKPDDVTGIYTWATCPTKKEETK